MICTDLLRVSMTGRQRVKYTTAQTASTPGTLSQQNTNAQDAHTRTMSKAVLCSFCFQHISGDSGIRD
jgi:hypothetical protein